MAKKALSASPLRHVKKNGRITPRRLDNGSNTADQWETRMEQMGNRFKKEEQRDGCQGMEQQRIPGSARQREREREKGGRAGGGKIHGLVRIWMGGVAAAAHGTLSALAASFTARFLFYSPPLLSPNC